MITPEKRPVFGISIDPRNDSNDVQIMRPMDEHLAEVIEVDELIVRAVALLASKRTHEPVEPFPVFESTEPAATPARNLLFGGAL